jgi:hypothetical protein
MCVTSGTAIAEKNLKPGDELFTISYGDVSTDFEDANTAASGWRINLSFEGSKKRADVLHALVIGYMETTADVTTVAQTTNYELKTLPIYYAPKYLKGQGAFKGFLKGALGWRFSDYKRTGALGNVESGDNGFYGGASAGLMFMATDTVFINAEYEWAYLSNSYYRDGEVQSAMIGNGFRF